MRESGRKTSFSRAKSFGQVVKLTGGRKGGEKLVVLVGLAACFRERPSSTTKISGRGCLCFAGRAFAGSPLLLVGVA